MVLFELTNNVYIHTKGIDVFEVHDGTTKVLRFEGKKLAASTSRRPGADRWVEFELYLTSGGSYILSRVGRSTIFHRPECSVVRRNHLEIGTPNEDSIPCQECLPALSEKAEVAVEQPRYWAQVSDAPEAVLDALYKTDSAGARYLTSVASRLIDKACQADPVFEKSYKVQFVH